MIGPYTGGITAAKYEDIAGIAPSYANTLRAAGVNTQKELLEIGSTQAGGARSKWRPGCPGKLVRSVPPLAKVQAWTTQARDLPRAIHY